MTKKILDFLALFTSVSTLFCCALPALFVTLGLGSSFVSLLHIFPQLTLISEHKNFVFIFGGTMLLLSGLLRVYSKNQMCPTDEQAASACKSTKRFSLAIYLGSLSLYSVGAFFAFVAPHLLQGE